MKIKTQFLIINLLALTLHKRQMFWAEVNPHWSISFQISFTICYFIFKHHVRNPRNLSFIEFIRCFGADHRCFSIEYSIIRVKMTAYKSNKCRSIECICIKCRVSTLEHKNARFYRKKSSDEKKNKRIHSQSLQNILRTEYHGSLIMNKHCSKFREFQRWYLGTSYIKRLKHISSNLLHTRFLDQFTLQNKRKTSRMHDISNNFWLSRTLNGKTDRTCKKIVQKTLIGC